jgi:RNA polymerase sigma factor (sigma-70 family)
MGGIGGDPREREYERHRAVVLRMLAKRFPRLDEDERLAIYHDAWTRVLVKRGRGETILSLRAYLVTTAAGEALHMLSRQKAPTPLGPDDPRLTVLADGAPPVDEQVVTRDQARIARGLLDTLDQRQRDVLKLRWDLQLSGGEVRAALGLSERQYKRLAEEGATALAERVEELKGGEWSRRTRSLLVACLVEVTHDGERRFGIASPRQREEAQRLLESDPHVAALYAELRRSVRGAAALLPLPVLAVEPTASPLARLAELGDDARDVLAGAKQHATSLYLRVGDPSLLAGGPRPGAAAVAVAGALAVSGGAYGAHEVATQSEPPAVAPLPPIAVAHASAVATGTDIASKSPKRAIARPNPNPKPITPDPALKPTPQPDPISQTPIASPTQSPPPAEFGFED